MFANIYKMSDAEFAVWLENFWAVFDANVAEFGLTATESNELKTIKDEMTAALNEKQASEETRQAKTVAFRGKRRTAVKKVAFYNTIFKANDLIADSLIEQLGLDSNDENLTSATPQQPLDLVAEGFSNGNNETKWKKNGNKPNTIYIIEGRLETQPNFAYVGSTTKTKFIHKNQTPGVRMFYRVKAQRNDKESTNSNEAVVY